MTTYNYTPIDTPGQIVDNLNFSNLDLTSGIKNIPKTTTTESKSKEDREKRKKELADERSEYTDEEYEAQKQAQLEALQKSREDNQVKIDNYLQSASSLDPTSPDYAEKATNILTQVRLLESININLQRAEDEREKKDKDGNDKWGIKEYGALITLIGGGLAIGEGLDRLFNSEDLSELNVTDELRKSAQASTDPETMDMIINAGYRDQPRITDLENLANYGNQFGSLSNELFNDPTYGTQLESNYQEFLKENPGIGRDQFLTEFARANPMNPLSQMITQKLSRIGQLEKATGQIANVSRNETLKGLDMAGKFYKPTSAGGLGFTPEQFRSPEQQAIVDRTMGLINSDEVNLLRNSVADRVRSQGRLGIDELRDITSDALTSVDPSLANQQYLGSGGLARSVLNTSGAKRNRLLQDESALNTILNAERGFIPTANNVVQSNTIDPVRAFGLTGTESSLANQVYGTNPTQGINYDPTSAYYSSLTGINQNIKQANLQQPSVSSEVTNIGQNVVDMGDQYKTLTS
jgi:hypothetical protein